MPPWRSLRGAAHSAAPQTREPMPCRQHGRLAGRLTWNAGRVCRSVLIRATGMRGEDRIYSSFKAQFSKFFSTIAWYIFVEQRALTKIDHSRQSFYINLRLHFYMIYNVIDLEKRNR
jgi:hypothetical protein